MYTVREKIRKFALIYYWETIRINLRKACFIQKHLKNLTKPIRFSIINFFIKISVSVSHLEADSAVKQSNVTLCCAFHTKSGDLYITSHIYYYTKSQRCSYDSIILFDICSFLGQVFYLKRLTAQQQHGILTVFSTIMYEKQHSLAITWTRMRYSNIVLSKWKQ